MAITSDPEVGVKPKPGDTEAQIEGTADAEDGEEADNDETEEEEEEEEEEPSDSGREKFNRALIRLSEGPVRIRVHDVIIRGNGKTKKALIEAEVLDAFRSASSMQELLRAAGLANARLRQLDIFESVTIVLDSGSSELPNTANVIIDIVEVKNPLSGDLVVYTKPEPLELVVHIVNQARYRSFEGSLKLKNLFGYGDIWDASGAYEFDGTSEISLGVSLPRFRIIPAPLTTRVLLLSQDWLKFSSYKEHLLGLSVGLISTRKHELTYNLTWCSLLDPSSIPSKSIRSQLGHSLLSSIRYSCKIDHRDSKVRPTRGYAFSSTSQIAGLGPDNRLIQFFRQDFDLRGAIPLGFYNAALNFGVTAGAVMPWAGFTNSSTPMCERFYMGSHSSPVCKLGRPASLFSFKQRGLGPTDMQRVISSKRIEDKDATSSGRDASGSIASQNRDAVGGDLAVTAFADLSFDLPLKVFRESGVHGHMFINVGNLIKLSEELTNFQFHRFLDTFRSSAGVGIVIPTRLFRMEINYCYLLKQSQHDHGKTGIQFSFSTS
ncbi:hypothetical protein ZIOFF_044079 [Zingiber officinale]|uniref:Bacterial surface antigen (D15) domain-containing protein n=1 Tax=Zingiber officinale TaxID=94328 RepID=A0A8J5FYH3_ZINOF|nr:hypothetical protein ZIOFF_044079 [Zingiber officinale]